MHNINNPQLKLLDKLLFILYLKDLLMLPHLLITITFIVNIVYSNHFIVLLMIWYFHYVF